MNNLVVDIGNTRVKVAVIVNDKVLCEHNFGCLDDDAYSLIGTLVSDYGVERAIVSSTRGYDFVERLRDYIDCVLLFDATTPVPIKNSYSTPETLGRDRLAAAVGADELYGVDYDAIMIVDAGTALTIDIVTRTGGFEGGVISLGVDIRFRALHEFTSNLPLCISTDEELEVARTTKEAIEQGVMSGIIYEIESHITKFMCRQGKKVIIFTGGDSKLLAKRIKNTIFAERELVLVGLNRILKYNAK